LNLNLLNPYLVSYWNLDESSGTRSDCVNTVNLWETNTVLSSTGKREQSSLFQGNEYLYAPHSNLIGSVVNTKGFMMSCWVMFLSPYECIIVDKNPYLKINTLNTNKWFATLSEVDFDGSIWDTIVENQWYHVFSGASDNLGFFSTRSIDGLNYIANEDMPSLISSTNSFIVGQDMKGKIDEFAVWSALSIKSIDDFLEIENDLYQNGTGLFYNCAKNIWQLPTTVNNLTSYQVVSQPVNANRIPSLSSVRTYDYTNGYKSRIIDASDQKATTGSINTGSASFGNFTPGEKSQTMIVKLDLPDSLIVRNIQIGLVDDGGIGFSSTMFGVGNLEYKDYNYVPEQFFVGLNGDDKNSTKNVQIPVDGRHSSVYVYLNVNVPKNFKLINGIIKYKWYFDWA